MTTGNESLTRLLKPRTIAVVGLSDASVVRDYIAPTLDGDAEVFFVHPKHDSVLGRPACPDLKSVGRPLDAVLTVTGPRATAEIVEQAADLGAGGVVSVSTGFAEKDAEGAGLQARVVAAARRSGMAVVGPNGLGYINVPDRISLTVASPHKRRPGGISVVSHSGAVLSGIAMAAWNHPGCGLNLLVSAGNEAVTDLADYVDFLAADPDTRAIGLVIEKIRRPEAFFAAARRAVEAGKPIVALKLARGERSQKMAQSHTGALTGDAWVYDVALRQAGVALARGPEELVDRLALADQLDPSRWSRVDGLAVITLTGGFASMSYDLATEEGLTLPPLTDLEPWVRANFPGITVANPLDTASSGTNWPELVRRYATAPETDALLFIHPLSDEDEAPFAARLVEEFAQAAQEAGQPFVVANCSGGPGRFVLDRLPAGRVAAGRGLHPTLRGLATMGAFVRYREAVRDAAAPVPPLPRPSATVDGSMLSFAASMELLESAGIPVAPYHLVPAGASTVRVPFAGPYVVKLADVAHRTEHGAVRAGVGAADLPKVVTELRDLAAAGGLPPLVVVQPRIASIGEAFVGIKGAGELGPMVVFGLGGVLVEALNRVGGRMAPLTRDDARSLIDEFADLKLMHGFRGRPAWDLDALTDILVAAGRLAVASRDWLDSAEANPLIYGPSGFLAVDALCLTRGEGTP